MSNTQEKFSKIYDENVEKIYRFVALKVGSDATAEDLTAETFSRGWKAFKKSEEGQREEIENIEGFLYRIARNLVADFYRHHEKIKEVPAEDVSLEDGKPGPDEEALKSSDAKKVKEALTELKSDYQNVIIWRHVEGMTTEQVAEEMDKSKGAVRVQLHRAMDQLKELLEEE